MENGTLVLNDERAVQSLRPYWLVVFLFCFLPPTLCIAQDVHADLPANNSIRIENRRGNVTVEVWNEGNVSVIASFEGETPKSSPVIIRNTKSLLNVLVASGATSSISAIRVNLLARVPKRSRVEIITNSGTVDVRGMSALITATTYSGDISVYLPTEKSANIRAETATGEITSEFHKTISGSQTSKSFALRLKGGAPLRLHSQNGHIALNLMKEPSRRAPGIAEETAVQSTVTQETPKHPPILQGSTNNQNAGTPAIPLTDGSQEVDEGDVVRVDTELVTLNVSVVDRATSRGLMGLVQSDFKIFEDGVEQEIKHFESSNAPFNLVLLIDLSGSTKEKLTLIRDAAQHFVDAARPEDSIAVITFAAQPVVVSRLTNDRRVLRQRISTIETAPGDTKLYDSINFAMTDALKDASGSRRSAIVVLSDGLDGTLPSVKGDGSALSYSEVLSQIREFDGVMYTLWVDTEYVSLSDKDTQPEDFDAGHDRMAEMADAGGGLFYEVAKLEDLAGAYERVVADIGTVYSIAYRPTNDIRDGKWRAIRVKIIRPNAVARGKSGYFAK